VLSPDSYHAKLADKHCAGDASATCSQDNLIFKGIYFDHLDAFCDPLPVQEPLIPGLTYVASEDLATEHASNCAGYADWVQHNAQAALSTLVNGTDIIGGWWAASYVNGTTSSTVKSLQHPGIDIWNQPWRLTEPPWACQNGKHGCNAHGRHSATSLRRMLRMKRDSEQRTVETQAAGLGVVRAASDLSLL
jgi:hypothetical protein